MDFAITILGVSGAAPAHGRFPTAQELKIGNQHFLLDCGEGTQMRMSEFNIPRSKINQIFISHLHGDHIFGLPGLLFSFALFGRTTPVDIYSPPGLEPIIRAQLQPGVEFPFPLRFHVLDCQKAQIIFEYNELTISSVPLLHRAPTCGFVFRETPVPKNIIPEKIQELGLSIPQIKSIKSGKDLQIGNQTISNNELTLPPYLPRSFAFISDTAYHEKIVPHIREVDLLYHETTFCEDAKGQATATMHSTAKQAANIAALAGAKTLVMGHYSTRYKDLSCFEKEARMVFPNAVLGVEGKIYEVEKVRNEK